MIEAPLAYAFTLGMVALVNPCGFALLPAYIGFFLGLDEPAAGGRLASMNRAQVVGLALSGGFLTVFGVLGLVFASIYTSIRDWLPWVTLVIGAGLMVAGLAMLAGRPLAVPLPKLDKGAGSRHVVSVYLFGVSYAVASLSCTIGLFLGAAGVAASGATFASRLASFLAYGAGMGLLATAVTLAVALGQRRLLTGLRSALPHVHRVSALVLVAVGGYIAYYGWWSVDPIGRALGPVRTVETVQAQVSGTLSDWAVPLGSVFAALNLALVAAGYLDRHRHPLDRPEGAPSMSRPGS